MKSDVVRTVPMSEARDDFAGLVNRAAYGQERVVLMRHGKPIAAIISADELAYFEELEDRDDLLAAQAAIDEGGETAALDEVEHARSR